MLVRLRKRSPKQADRPETDSHCPDCQTWTQKGSCGIERLLPFGRRGACPLARGQPATTEERGPRYPAGSRASRKSAGSRPRTTQPTAHAQPVRPAASARKARKPQGSDKDAQRERGGGAEAPGLRQGRSGVRKPQGSGKGARVRASRSGPEDLPNPFPEPSPKGLIPA